MVEKHVQVENTVLSYFQKGSAPKWLIYSGTHGDEADVIPLLKEYLETHKNELPDFIWVPAASPSAVRLGTRLNERGENLNRIFSDESNDPEVIAHRELLKGKKFAVFIDFHEDPSTHAFYMYDSIDARGTEKFATLFSAVEALGVPLYQGLDDEDMGWNVEDGYVVCAEYDTAPNMPIRSTSWKYLRDNAMVQKRLLNPEIPGLAPRGIKEKLVASMFNFIQ